MTPPRGGLHLVRGDAHEGPDDPRRSADEERRQNERRGGGGGGAGGGGNDFPVHKLILSKGRYSGCVHNTTLLLQQHPQWIGVIAWDEFAQRIVFTREPPFEEYAPRVARPKNSVEPLGEEEDDRESSGPTTGDPPKSGGREVREEDFAAIHCWIRRFGPPPLRTSDGGTKEVPRIEVSTETVAKAVMLVAKANPIHPVKDYIESVRWDGVRRIGDIPTDPQNPGAAGWLATYLGAEDCLYTRLVGRWFLISSIARIYDPGCQVHTMMVLEGQQGRGKSTAIRALFSPWYSNDLPDTTSKDALQQLAGTWGQEVEEMDVIAKGGVNSAKRFISKASDRYRPPYGRVPVDVPRTCVFIGTTNDTVYLSDTTGNRRYHPVQTGLIDYERLRQDRLQLFAEALLYYRAGEKWHPNPEDKYLLEEQQMNRLETDPWVPELRRWLQGRISAELPTENEAFHKLNIGAERQGMAEMRRMTRCFQYLGLHRIPKQDGSWAWQYATAPATQEPAPPVPPPAPEAPRQMTLGDPPPAAPAPTAPALPAQDAAPGAPESTPAPDDDGWD